MEDKREPLLKPQEDKYIAIEDGDELHELEEEIVSIRIDWEAVFNLVLVIILTFILLCCVFLLGAKYQRDYGNKTTDDMIVDVIRDFCTDESVLKYDSCEGGYGDDAYMCYNYTFKEMTITFMTNN